MWMLHQADMENVVLVDGSDMDIVSFDDSEQFEEGDSVCSWASDTDQALNWSGWKRSSPISMELEDKDSEKSREVISLIELSSRCVAHHYPFEVVEHHKPPIPEGLQLRIAFWSFPESEEEIRLYSCLASGSNEKFKLGDSLAKSGNVLDVLQIGFHLSGVVTQPVSHTPAKQVYNVAITFDRSHVTSCQCSCPENAAWCEHATAVCLYRIFNREEISLRAPVSESLARLERDQLQKFAQYLISELPQQILPTAQRLLDELLSSKQSAINLVDGAPDPTAGASICEEAKWVLDELSLRENIKKILARFCGALPLVVVDVSSAFLTSAPPVSLEWSNFIRSFQGRDPEAIWNLLLIVRHMHARGDRNASSLLHYITEECLLCYQMMFYWISSYKSLQGNNGSRNNRSDNIHGPLHSMNDISRHTSAHLMEEIVHVWELTIMAPYLPADEKLCMKEKLEMWNRQVIEAAKKGQGQGTINNILSRMVKDFPGFNVAILACDTDWDMFYKELEIFDCLTRESSLKGRSVSTLEERKNMEVGKMYHNLAAIIPSDTEEFILVNKLTQALCCHGYVNRAWKLASILAHKIITSYPDRLISGQMDFTCISEKANNICEILLRSDKNESIAFELAILALTIPRLPARTNVEEVKLTCLEMSLYKKLKDMVITADRLAFIRYQAQKLIANPMLRGDIVLPLIMATFIFEVLCGESVPSTVLQGENVRLSPGCSRCNDDVTLGYQCALVSLGLSSNAVDQKQPLLCESIRHHRRDLALAVLTHCRTEDDKVLKILSILLDKERYSFMSSIQGGNSTGAWIRAEEKKRNKNRGDGEQKATPNLQAKYGFSFADINASIAASNNRSTERPVKQSSDSDSGHGDGGNKRLSSKNLHASVGNTRKSQQQRRHNRQNISKLRADKNSRNDRPLPKHNKATRPRKVSKAKSSRELTESDSGQEMHFSFDGESAFKSENWDAEIETTHILCDEIETPLNLYDKAGEDERAEMASSHNHTVMTADPVSLESHLNANDESTETLPKIIPNSSIEQTRPSQPNEESDHPSGEESSVSSLESLTNDNKPENSSLLCLSDRFASSISENFELLVQKETGELPLPNVEIPLILRESSVSLVQDDAGFDEDFNIEVDMFQNSTVTSSQLDLTSDGQAHLNKTLDQSHQLKATLDHSDDVKETLGQSDHLEKTLYQSHDLKETSDQSDNLKQTLDQTDLVKPVVERSKFIDQVPLQCEEDSKAVKRSVLDAEPVLRHEKTQDSANTNLCNLRKESKHDGMGDDASVLKSQSTTQFKPSCDDGGDPEEKSSSTQKKTTVAAEEKEATSLQYSSLISEKIDSAESLYNEASSLSTSSSVDSGTDQVVNRTKTLVTSETLSVTSYSDVRDEKQCTRNLINMSELRAALQTVEIEPIASQHVNNAATLNCDTLVVTAEKKEEQPAKSRKQKQNKKNKAKVTMNIQSIEAEAYSLFELAKSVLLQARNTAIFSSDADEVNTTNVINKRLQLAAFQIGLFALNVHNYSSPNWFSRTYSNYVSWIENQAVDIGTLALRVLNEKWKGVLTPSESIQIATRASRSGDSMLKRTAAELSLSCLPHAQSLCPVDISQTITMCREQDEVMLERACSAVENAARNGGVQPELLFRIAREWHYLHEQRRKLEGSDDDQNVLGRNPRVNGTLNQNVRSEVPAPVYMTPEQFVQEQMHQQAQEMLGRQLPRNINQDQFAWIYPQYYGALHHCPLPQQAIHSRRIQNIDSYVLPVSNFPEELNLSDIPRYLQNSYRVGMRAVEALTLRMPDDRPDIKYALAPPSSEDIRWMCALAASLGPPYLKNFCKIVYNAVTSPYLLHDLALEAARHFALFNPAQLASHLRSPSVSPIVQKALAMYTELVHHDLVLLGPPGYAGFVDLLRRTRSAFCMAPGGMARFNEILEVVRKTYPKRRELWQLIMTGLSKA